MRVIHSQSVDEPDIYTSGYDIALDMGDIITGYGRPFYCVGFVTFDGLAVGPTTVNVVETVVNTNTDAGTNTSRQETYVLEIPSSETWDPEIQTTPIVLNEHHIVTYTISSDNAADTAPENVKVELYVLDNLQDIELNAALQRG